MPVNYRFIGNGLRKGNVECCSLGESHIKLARVTSGLANLQAVVAACTDFIVYKFGVLQYLDIKITDIAVYFSDFSTNVQFDVRVLGHLDHPRGQNALGAIEGGERL